MAKKGPDRQPPDTPENAMLEGSSSGKPNVLSAGDDPGSSAAATERETLEGPSSDDMDDMELLNGLVDYCIENQTSRFSEILDPNNIRYLIKDYLQVAGYLGSLATLKKEGESCSPASLRHQEKFISCKKLLAYEEAYFHDLWGDPRSSAVATERKIHEGPSSAYIDEEDNVNLELLNGLVDYWMENQGSPLSKIVDPNNIVDSVRDDYQQALGYLESWVKLEKDGESEHLASLYHQEDFRSCKKMMFYLETHSFDGDSGDDSGGSAVGEREIPEGPSSVDMDEEDVENMEFVNWLLDYWDENDEVPTTSELTDYGDFLTAIGYLESRRKMMENQNLQLLFVTKKASNRERMYGIIMELTIMKIDLWR